MIFIHAFSLINALGNNNDEIASNLAQGLAPGMRQQTGWLQHGVSAVFAAVNGTLPAVPEQLACHRSRNNQLLLAALAPLRQHIDTAIAHYGRQRVALVLGTSTSGLDEADRFVSGCSGGATVSNYHYYQQELGDPSRFLAALLDLDGPSFTLSTACSSSARAIISGCRLLAADLADMVIAGGADSLSRMPINGFHSLESLSLNRCQPFARNRCGITIGEGAALMLLSRQPAADTESQLTIAGYGESSDAWHISAPHPQGTGAQNAIQQALQQAQISTADIGYINLHGTGTVLNDQIEASVIHRLFGSQTPCSSTKHLTGHTLGAAGVTEAALCALILQRRIPLPAQDFSQSALDDRLPDCGLLQQPAQLMRPLIMSNSFAFGGNNTSLLIGGT